MIRMRSVLNAKIEKPKKKKEGICGHVFAINDSSWKGEQQHHKFKDVNEKEVRET